MEQNKVDMFIMANAQFFESHQLMQIRDRLVQLDDSRWPMIQIMDFKNPTIMLVVSLLGGSLGIDRFIIGDIGMGVGKLLTLGGCGVWALVDWFLIMGATREKNMMKIWQVL